MSRARLFSFLLLGLVVVTTTVRAQADTDAEVSGRLLDEILAPMSTAAREVSAEGIAILGLPAQDGTERRFFDEVGSRLLAEGFDVWVLREGAAVPGGALALELELTTSEIDYPRQTRTLMGAGRARVQRRVSLGAHMKLSSPDSGQLLYDAEPVRVGYDWLSFTEANDNAAMRNDWIGAEPIIEMRERNAWWQRVAILGIVGGVAAIYFGGAT
ncbi:hypothetical protein DRQ53_01215 [bacterium]|nr:MAG: hypothetical protein DRQ53_01215 [bacterium]